MIVQTNAPTHNVFQLAQELQTRLAHHQVKLQSSKVLVRKSPTVGVLISPSGMGAVKLERTVPDIPPRIVVGLGYAAGLLPGLLAWFIMLQITSGSARELMADVAEVLRTGHASPYASRGPHPAGTYKLFCAVLCMPAALPGLILLLVGSAGAVGGLLWAGIGGVLLYLRKQEMDAWEARGAAAPAQPMSHGQPPPVHAAPGQPLSMSQAPHNPALGHPAPGHAGHFAGPAAGQPHSGYPAAGPASGQPHFGHPASGTLASGQAPPPGPTGPGYAPGHGA